MANCKQQAILNSNEVTQNHSFVQTTFRQTVNQNPARVPTFRRVVERRFVADDPVDCASVKNVSRGGSEFFLNFPKFIVHNIISNIKIKLNAVLLHRPPHTTLQARLPDPSSTQKFASAGPSPQ
jgi:hypothetical protein